MKINSSDFCFIVFVLFCTCLICYSIYAALEDSRNKRQLEAKKIELEMQYGIAQFNQCMNHKHYEECGYLLHKTIKGFEK